MRDDPIAEFREAEAKYRAAVQRVKDLREVLSPLDVQIRDDWASLKVDNDPAFRPSFQHSVRATGAHIDARK
jgi:hypothetical protein